MISSHTAAKCFHFYINLCVQIHTDVCGRLQYALILMLTVKASQKVVTPSELLFLYTSMLIYTISPNHHMINYPSTQPCKLQNSDFGLIANRALTWLHVIPPSTFLCNIFVHSWHHKFNIYPINAVSRNFSNTMQRQHPYLCCVQSTSSIEVNSFGDTTTLTLQGTTKSPLLNNTDVGYEVRPTRGSSYKYPYLIRLDSRWTWTSIQSFLFLLSQHLLCTLIYLIHINQSSKHDWL